MKTLHALAGLAIGCLLSGCDHGPTKPASDAARNSSVLAATNQAGSVALMNAGTAPITYQWPTNGSNIGGAVNLGGVTNR